MTSNRFSIFFLQFPSTVQENLTKTKKEADALVESINESRKLIDDYKEGIASILKPQLQELKREGDSKISLGSEKREYRLSTILFLLISFCLLIEMVDCFFLTVTEAQSNIKRADAKLISLATASAMRQVEFDRWNDTLATKLQKLKDKIAEARNTAEGVSYISF